MDTLVCDMSCAIHDDTREVSHSDEALNNLDITLILDALSETALYWSLVKVPAQLALVVSTVPYAVALINILHQRCLKRKL